MRRVAHAPGLVLQFQVRSIRPDARIPRNFKPNKNISFRRTVSLSISGTPQPTFAATATALRQPSGSQTARESTSPSIMCNTAGSLSNSFSVRCYQRVELRESTRGLCGIAHSIDSRASAGHHYASQDNPLRCPRCLWDALA